MKRFKLFLICLLLAVCTGSQVSAAQTDGYINKWLILNSDNSRLPDKSINALVEDGANGFWIGTSGSGFLHYRASGLWDTFPQPSIVEAMEKDAEGGLWIGALSGLYHLNKDKTIDYLAFDKSISCFYTLEEGKLLIGTKDQGIYIMDGNHEPEVYSETLNQEIGQTRINTILSDNRGGLLIGTADKGLFHLESSGTIRVHTSENSLLLSDAVTSLLSYVDGQFLVGTPRGIFLLYADATWQVFVQSVNITTMERSGTGKAFFAGTWFGGIYSYTFDGKWINYSSSNSDLPDNSIVQISTMPGGEVWVATMNGGISKFEQYNVLSISVEPETIDLYHPDDSASFVVQQHLSNGDVSQARFFDVKVGDPQVALYKDNRVWAQNDGTTTMTITLKTGGNTLTANVDLMVSLDEISIEVTPAYASMEAGESFIPKVKKVYADGLEEKVNDFSLSLVSGEGVVQLNGKTITAASPGTALVKIQFDENQFEIQIIVDEVLPLVLGQTKVLASTGETVSLEILSGKGPFQVTAGSVADKIWTFNVGETGGIFSQSISDVYGNRVTISVEVEADLTIHTPGGDQIKQGGTTDLYATGGVPPYTWAVSGGTLSSYTSVEGEKLVYTTPIKSGMHTVSVVDQAGQSCDYMVNTFRKLMTTPQRLHVIPGTEREFQVIGGVPPYAVTTDAGQIEAVTGKNNAFCYTAPKVEGAYIIKVRDDQNNETSATAIIRHNAMVTPSRRYLKKGEAATFKIAGGIGKDEEMHLHCIYGKVDLNPKDKTFRYVAPNIVKTDTIILTDMDGEVTKATVDVLSSIYKITPTNPKVFLKETMTFRVFGEANGDVIWTTTLGDIFTPYDTTDRIDYLAPKVKCQASLKAMDKVLRETSVDIDVISYNIFISPMQEFFLPGEERRFRVFGGTGDYSFTWTEGSLVEEDKDGDGMTDTVVYTAPDKPGEYFITVYDTTGWHAVAMATVSGGSIRTLRQGSTYHEVIFPEPWPNSANQPMGVGSLVQGGDSINFSVDFPSYIDANGDPLPMNYYIVLESTDQNIWLAFTEQGIRTMDQLAPLMARETSPIFSSLLHLPLLQFPKGRWIAYALAVSSVDDPNMNLSLAPETDLEFWSFSFTVK